MSGQQYDWISALIREGGPLPGRWPEAGEPGYEASVEVDEEQDGPSPSRWWEQEGLTLDEALLRGGQ